MNVVLARAEKAFERSGGPPRREQAQLTAEVERLEAILDYHDVFETLNAVVLNSQPTPADMILPENPSAVWMEAFEERVFNQSVYRLGILTLLEPSINQRRTNFWTASRSRYVLTIGLQEARVKTKTLWRSDSV